MNHYKCRGGIEPIEFIRSNNLNFMEGCVVKYVYRYKFKGGMDDLKKAMQYLQWLMEDFNSELSAEIEKNNAHRKIDLTEGKDHDKED